MNKIIDGKEISKTIKNNLKGIISSIKEEHQRVPKLVVIIVGENPASQVYVRNKEKACNEVGIESEIIRLPEDVSEEKLIDIISLQNKDAFVDGILVQLPLPKHINEKKVLNEISPTKDVDGFHPENIAKLFLGEQELVPCTPQGIICLLESINYDLKGKNVVIVGRSNIVGKPLALLALHKNATVTITHSKTENLKEVCNKADVLITAIGKANFFTSDYIKEGAIVIDVGINRDENGLCGDVAFHLKTMDEESEKIYKKVSAITPVPGGVGPMTIAMLLQNTISAYEERQKYFEYLVTTCSKIF